MPVYYSDGRRWGTVAANCYVATDRNLCGSSHPDWAYIKYVQSSSGDWVNVGYTSDGYGFVDTGIRPIPWPLAWLCMVHGNFSYFSLLTFFFQGTDFFINNF